MPHATMTQFLHTPIRSRSRRSHSLCGPIRALCPSWRKPANPRSGAASPVFPASPGSSAASNCRPPAPARSGAGCRRPSIPSITIRSAARAPTGSAGSACPQPRSNRSRRLRMRSRRASSISTISVRATPTPPMPRLIEMHGIGPVDRRHLSAVLPRPCRCVAGRRSRLAGIGAYRARLGGPAQRQGTDGDRRRMAALARRGGASALGAIIMWSSGARASPSTPSRSLRPAKPAAAKATRKAKQNGRSQRPGAVGTKPRTNKR
jgi:hypothetical protein